MARLRVLIPVASLCVLLVMAGIALSASVTAPAPTYENKLFGWEVVHVTAEWCGEVYCKRDRKHKLDGSTWKVRYDRKKYNWNLIKKHGLATYWDDNIGTPAWSSLPTPADDGVYKWHIVCNCPWNGSDVISDRFDESPAVHYHQSFEFLDSDGDADWDKIIERHDQDDDGDWDTATTHLPLSTNQMVLSQQQSDLYEDSSFTIRLPSTATADCVLIGGASLDRSTSRRAATPCLSPSRSRMPSLASAMSS